MEKLIEELIKEKNLELAQLMKDIERVQKDIQRLMEMQEAK